MLLAELGPQAADVDIDDVRIGLEADVPYLARDESSWHRFAAVTRQQREQGELFWRQIKALVAAPSALVDQVDIEIADL